MNFILFFFLDFRISEAECMHEYFQNLGPNPFNRTISIQYHQLLASSSTQPIRVIFDFSSITNKKEYQMCTKINQTISWNDKTFQCRESDIITEEKLNVINQTFLNIGKYLRRLLKVIPETKEINVGPFRDINCDRATYTADLVISIASRPHGPNSKVLGSAFTEEISLDTGRPTLGGMYLNPFYIPKEPQNSKSQDRLYFTVLLHEIIHVLGFSKNAMSYWIDRRTGKPYKETIDKVTIKQYNKTFYLLTTPKAMKFAEQRFGIRYFSGYNRIGIELENHGGNGTALSHPESRVYLFELMCGTFVGHSFISNLTLSVLYDTGWYDVDFSMAEPYPWGNGESMLLPPIQSFPNKPPQLSYPSHYLCWPNDKNIYDHIIQHQNINNTYGLNDTFDPYLCSYDFMAKAYCSPSAFYNCSSTNHLDVECCQMQKFTNPYQLPLRGDRSEFDYMIFKVSNTSLRCNDEIHNNEFVRTMYGEEYGINSMCVMSNLASKEIESNFKRTLPRCHQMLCDSQQRLFINISSHIIECHYENENITLKEFNGALICPRPSHICGMKQFLNLPSFEQVVKHDYNFKYRYTIAQQSSAEISHNELIIAISIIVFFVIIIYLMILLVMKIPIMRGSKFILIQSVLNQNDSSFLQDPNNLLTENEK